MTTSHQRIRVNVIVRKVNRPACQFHATMTMQRIQLSSCDCKESCSVSCSSPTGSVSCSSLRTIVRHASKVVCHKPGGCVHMCAMLWCSSINIEWVPERVCEGEPQMVAPTRMHTVDVGRPTKDNNEDDEVELGSGNASNYIIPTEKEKNEWAKEETRLQGEGIQILWLGASHPLASGLLAYDCFG